MKLKLFILISVIIVSYSFEWNGYDETVKCSRVYFPGRITADFPVDTAIDVTYYGLQLKLQLNPNYLYGSVTVNGKFRNQGDFMFLNFSNVLSVDSVTGNGIQSYTHTDNLIRIYFDAQRSDFSVNVYYKGLPSSTGNGSFVFSNSLNSIWTLSEPYGSSDWFPNKNTPSDKADSSFVSVTCPQNLTAVSNGLLKETIVNPDNTKTYKWKSSYPIASYLISIAVADYTLYTNYFRYSQSDSMPVTHYIYPPNLNNVRANLDLTPGMLEVFSSKYSLYPFINEKYGHAQFGWGGGMEHQTISSMGSFGSGIIAHELAHQWYGDKVTCRDFHHIWLNEGFATFSEGLYIESTQGKEAYDYFVIQKMNAARNASGSVYVTDINSINEIFNYNRSYAKGAVILHMLRGVTGDSVFFNIMRSYATDTSTAYRSVVTEDFRRIAEQVSGMNLGYFFNEWIYGVNYPKYNLDWNKVRVSNGTWQVNLSVMQSINPSPSFFTMPVKINFSTRSGDTVLKILNNAQNQNFTLILNDEPLYMTFDPFNEILKEKKGDIPIEKIDFRLDQNYPNPFNPSTKINYSIKEYGDVLIKIYDITGREIKTIVNEKQRPGSYLVEFSPENFSSGVYFYKLISNGLTDTKKMVYVR